MRQQNSQISKFCRHLLGYFWVVACQSTDIATWQVHERICVIFRFESTSANMGDCQMCYHICVRRGGSICKVPFFFIHFVSIYIPQFQWKDTKAIGDEFLSAVMTLCQRQLLGSFPLWPTGINGTSFCSPGRYKFPLTILWAEFVLPLSFISPTLAPFYVCFSHRQISCSAFHSPPYPKPSTDSRISHAATTPIVVWRIVH